jgi:hypothetical protein
MRTVEVVNSVYGTTMGPSLADWKFLIDRDS